VLELFRRAGAGALLKFEFYFRSPEDYAPKRVRVESVNEDGQTFKVMDLAAKNLVEKSVFPGELTVGLATRSENDPVIKLLQQLKIDPRPFLDPNLRVGQLGGEEFRTPASRSDQAVPHARSAPPIEHQDLWRNLPRCRSELGAGFRASAPLPIRFPQPVRGEFIPRGGRTFQPFRPFPERVRPEQFRPVMRLEGREDEQLRRGRRHTHIFTEGEEREESQEVDSGLYGRRQWGRGGPEAMNQQERGAAWHARADQGERIGYFGRRMGHRAEERRIPVEEEENPYREGRWEQSGRREGRGETDVEAEEVRGGWRRRNDREERVKGAEAEEEERMHGRRSTPFWGPEVTGLGSRMRGRVFLKNQGQEDEVPEGPFFRVGRRGDEIRRFGRGEGDDAGARPGGAGGQLETRTEALKGIRKH
jgi:hypothetical protein